MLNADWFLHPIINGSINHLMLCGQVVSQSDRLSNSTPIQVQQPLADMTLLGFNATVGSLVCTLAEEYMIALITLAEAYMIGLNTCHICF